MGARGAVSSGSRLALGLILVLTACDRGDPVDVPRSFLPPWVVFSNHGFEHERAGAPKVAALRERERLDEVVAGADSEIAVFEALTLWARRQFVPGIPDPYPPSNGLDLLDEIRAGRTGGFCGQYAYLLADALKSLGFWDVRYVEGWADERSSHFLVEAWSNELGRWVVLDPLHAATVVDDGGRSLSAAEVHDAAVGAEGAPAARRKWLAPESEVPHDDERRYLEHFRLIAVSLRNDLAEAARPWTIAERRAEMLALRDAANEDLLPGNYRRQSSRRADFEGARNLCRATIEPGDGGFAAGLETLGTCAHFAGFEVRIDDGAWVPSSERARLPAAFRSVECRCVNALGIRGVVTRVETAGP